jgi:uncharacterized membrane protein YccC
VLTGGPTSDERDARMTAGVDELADGGSRRPIVSHPRFLLVVASALMTFGVSLILLGWYGAANSTLLEEQVPYLISGGLLGVALATVGAVTLFANWLTVLIREARDRETARRQDHVELMETLRTLAATLEHQEDRTNGSARSAKSQRPVRGTPRRS